MRIAIGADHAGFKAKEQLKEMLRKLGHEVLDQGTNSEESCDYPEFAKKVAGLVSKGDVERGVLICGTGIGMAMTANKFSDVRAAVVYDELTAEMSRRHNNANVFCSGARPFDADKLKKFLKIWLDSPFDGGRHDRRVKQISDLDEASNE